MPRSSNPIQQTNYMLRNPAIKALLGNFINKIGELLANIDAPTKLGLDAGCGEGHLLGRLNAHHVFGEVIGVDADVDHLAFAADQCPQVVFSAADLARLPFRTDTFDYIISTEVFEHLTDPSAALLELKRVAKKNADLIISVPFEPFFHWGNLIRGKYWRRGGYTPDHRHFWRRDAFRRFLTPVVLMEKHYAFRSFPWMLVHCRFR